MEYPEIGDAVHIRANANSSHAGATGFVSKVRSRRAGDWTAVEVKLAGQLLWFEKDDIDAVQKERNPFKRESGSNLAPCRLFVILARDASTAAIFRRGPSRWVQLIKWNTATDTFEPGQWFLGRIYEHRADLSPDGSKLIYFASKVQSRGVCKKDIEVVC